MKKIYLFAAGVLAFSLGVNAQSFSNSSNLVPGSYNSGGPTGVTDMNNDGLDDIIILDQSTDVYVAYQQPDGSFVVEFYDTVSSDEQWGMCVGDIDNDGFGDVLSGGYYDGVHVVNINEPGVSSTADYPFADIFMQACNMADINNDGWLDAFACHDDGPSFRLRNSGNGMLVDGNDLFDYNVYPDSDMSGNYGSVWTDFDRDGDLDLMVAKCRQFVNDPYDPRRTNLLFLNDGNNNYTDVAHERGLVNLQQSWTSDWADIDNDGDFDCFITTHSGGLELYENNGLGYFTDITEGAGLTEDGFFLQAKLVDFDNDGFLDIIYAGGDHAYFHNNGDKTFTEVPNAFPAPDVMHAFATGDLNNDGWVDVYANYGNSYVTPDNQNDDRLFLNEGGTNNWVKFDLEGTISNTGAVGAVIEIFGPWGRQIRDVRAGESYGITCSHIMHFGIGDAEAIDYAIIRWPAGGITVIEDPAINTQHEIIESDCTGAAALTITANGGTAICPGSTVELSVNAGNASYLWSTGATTSAITVETPGLYSVFSYDNEGCATISNVIEVEEADYVEPTITVDGDLEFCEGASVSLIASEGEAYTWSNGSTSQTLVVTEAGDYSVSVNVEGECGFISTETISVAVLDSPDSPTATDVTLNEQGSTTLNATGTNVLWYDSPDATVAVGTGNSFETPFLLVTTSYWVEDVTTYGGIEGTGGKLVNESAPFGQYHNSASYWNKFDAYEDFYIVSVKVFAGNAGVRNIQLVDASSTVLAQGDFDIPQGESIVNLNFFCPAGTGYGLRTTTSNPQLWRDRNTDVPAPFAYPYDLDGLGAITGTTVGGADTDNYYYFFYDWTVQTPMWECASPREEVQVIILGLNEIEGLENLSLFPNPVNDQFVLDFSSLTGGAMRMNIIDALGRTVSSTQVVSVSGRNQVPVNAESLTSGVYQVQLVRDNQVSSIRFVVK